MLSQSLTAAGAAALATQTASAAERPAGETFGYSLNTSTIRGQKLPLTAEIDIAARGRLSGDRTLGLGNRRVRRPAAARCATCGSEWSTLVLKSTAG